MPKKRRTPPFVGDLTDDWDNRLAFIDGEFEEEEEPEEKAAEVTEAPELERATKNVSRRKRKRRVATPEKTGRSLEQQRAEDAVTRELNNLVDASILNALPQIAVKLSLKARTTMKNASRYKAPYDIALVSEYLRRTAATFDRVGRQRDAGHFRVMLIDWLAENGRTREELTEALDLISPTRGVLTAENDSASLVKLDQLKTEIRRRLSELK
jgi:hypothetical protein